MTADAEDEIDDKQPVSLYSMLQASNMYDQESTKRDSNILQQYFVLLNNDNITGKAKEIAMANRYSVICVQSKCCYDPTGSKIKINLCPILRRYRKFLKAIFINPPSSKPYTASAYASVSEDDVGSHMIALVDTIDIVETRYVNSLRETIIC